MIGTADSHKQILQSPELISQYVLDRGLDSGTCFEIISMDISDISVDENVGARLQAVQAMADKRVAQARAEMRRAAAVAAHTEMQARTTEMKSKVEAARAVVPRAVANAFRVANLGSHLPLRPTVGERIRWDPNPRRG